MDFNWHSDPITRTTVVDGYYKNTQNVRRFMIGQCGTDFKFDRVFITWIRDGIPKTMGDIADEWQRRHRNLA